MTEKLFWVVTYNVKPEKTQEYFKFNETKRAADIFDRLEKETAVRRLAMYHTVFGHEDHEFETWFEIPNYAAIDRVRESKAAKELMGIVSDYYESARWKIVKQDAGKLDAKWKSSDFSWL